MKLLYSYMGRSRAYVAKQLYHLNTHLFLHIKGLVHTYACKILVAGAMPVAFFCFIMFSYAQAQSPDLRETVAGLTNIKPLSIGDTIPEELWHVPLQVVNHPEGREIITLNDYRDKKLIILDFWSSWCSSCLKSFPKLVKQQELFDSEINIILVNDLGSRDTDARAKYSIDRTLQKAGIGKYRLMSIMRDNILINTFPPGTIPHVVWIEGKSGKIAAIGKDNLMSNENLIEYFDRLDNKGGGI